MLVEVKKMCKECSCGPHLHGEEHPSDQGRRFLTNEEKAKKLENYAENLRNELVSVEERIKEL